MLIAVVVGHADLGDTDRIVRFLTAERGRVDLVARGARVSKKRFGGLLEIGTRVRVEAARSRGSLASIAQIELLRPVDRARRDLDRIALLAYGCEVVARLAGADMPEPKLTKLLVVWLEMLELDPCANSASRVALEAKALTFAGILPSLTQCAQCGEDLDAPVVFGFETGVMHGRCGPGRPVDLATLAAVDRLRRMPLFDTLGEEPFSEWILSDFIQDHGNKELKSRGLLSDLSQM